MDPMKETDAPQADKVKITERGRIRKWSWKLLLAAGLLTGASAFLYSENDSFLFGMALLFAVMEILFGLCLLLSSRKNPMTEEELSIPDRERTKRALTRLSGGLLLALLLPLLLYGIGFLRGNAVKQSLVGKTYYNFSTDMRSEMAFHSDGEYTLCRVDTGGYAEKIISVYDGQYTVYVSLDGKYSLIADGAQYQIEDSYDGKYTKEDAEKIDYFKSGKVYYTLITESEKTESVRGQSMSDGIAAINSSLARMGMKSDPVKDADYIGAAKMIIDGILKNPSSAVYNSESIYDKDAYGRVIVHLNVSAQNSFGGYVRSDYYVCIREMDSDGHFTYSTSMSYVDEEYLVGSLKSANGFGEPIYKAIKDFRIGNNPRTACVTVGDQVLEQYTYSTNAATYVFYVNPDTGYVVSAEISVHAEWVLNADVEDRMVWNDAVSDLDGAFAGSIWFSDVDHVFDLNWNTGEVTVSEEPAFVDDGYILSAAEENGVYRYCITDGRTLGFTEEVYWTPIRSQGIPVN